MIAPLLFSLALAPSEPAPPAAPPPQERVPITDTESTAGQPDDSSLQHPPAESGPAEEEEEEPPPLVVAPASTPAGASPPEQGEDQPSGRGEGQLEHRERSATGFGGLRLRPTAVGNDFGFLIGGGGAAVLAGHFIIGGEGYGMIAFAGNAGTRTIDGESKNLALQMGYGGLNLGWILGRPGVLDFSVQTLLGGGSVTLDTGDRSSSQYVDSAGMFIAEPEVVMYIKVAPMFRLGIAASYRFVAHETWSGPSGLSLMGPSGAVFFDWGSF